MSDVVMRVQSFLAKFILALPRLEKRFIVLVLDTGLCILSIWLAFYLRLDYFIDLTGVAMWAVLASVVLALPIFIRFGFYRAIFRYNGLIALMVMARAMMIYGVLFASVFTIYQVPGIPRSVGLLQPILLLLLVLASRVFARLWLGSLYNQHLFKASLPQALIYGAGNTGRQLAVALSNSREIRVVGYLDDDYHLQGSNLNGLPVHNPADLAKILNTSPITEVLLAIPSVKRQRRNNIINNLKPHKLVVRTLPSFSDIVTGKVSFSDVRELDIYDLLGREPVEPDLLLLNLNTHRKTVLVTGAGGSIGSELCRQILKMKPQQLLLVEMSEFALYQIHQELVELLTEGFVDVESIKIAPFDEFSDESYKAPKIMGVEIIPLLASVCDEVRMHEIMETWKPQTVYHAAAYKHVYLVEHNPAEGIRNNVWGTRVCAEAAIRNDVHNFVLVSTDKAVRPTNIMGATKRLAEMVIQALVDLNVPATSEEGGALSTKTTFSIVRFGNVLDSSGSVVPLFRRQIKNGGPITITHAEITRYFMSIPEAAQLVIQAGAMGQGGDVFVLDMGQPVKISELARRMVEFSGLSIRDELHPHGDIELIVTGLRPGEKLYEELLIGSNPKPTQHPLILKAHEEFLNWSELEHKLSALGVAISVNNSSVIRLLLKDLVSGYTPNGEVVDWVHMVRESKA